MSGVYQHPDLTGASQDYARIARAIAFLRARHATPPSLGDLADHLELSEAYTQRLFSRWAGISPKRFQQLLGVEAAKRRMRETADLLGVALESGLSGPGRLHDLFVKLEALSPGEFRRAAAGLTLTHGIGATPFGPARVVFGERGICYLAFVDAGDGRDGDADVALAARWPAADLRRDDAAAGALLARVFARPGEQAGRGLSLWISGTNFQVQVWRALLQVPFGGLLSYRQLAQGLGRPSAARAVGSAVARNPVGFLIPCHRVLRDSGDFGIYHWGTERKIAICAWESGAAGDPR